MIRFSAASFLLGYSTILPALVEVLLSDFAEETCHPLLVLVRVAWAFCGAASSV